MNFFQDLNLFGTTSVGSFADSAAATVSGWFNPSPASKAAAPASKAAAEPSLWDRFTDGVGDLGRGLSMEGLDGLRDLGGMLDRQQAIRTGPEEIPVGPGDHDRHDGHTPLARDTRNTGWTRCPDGKWSEAGDLGARPKTAFALSDYKYLKESETYFQNGADRTKYYDDQERAAHKMQAGVDGRLFDGQGKLANTAGSSALLKGSGLDTHGARVRDRAHPLDELHAHARQILAHQLRHHREQLAGAALHPLQLQRGVESQRHPVDLTLLEAGEVERGLAQRLGGNAAVGDHDPTRVRPPLDHRDALAEVRGLGRGLLARRTGAEHHEVVAFAHAFGSAASGGSDLMGLPSASCSTSSSAISTRTVTARCSPAPPL